jgi:methylmalonyl-CoA mutase
VEDLSVEREGGADALWIPLDRSLLEALSPEALAHTFFVLDPVDPFPTKALDAMARMVPSSVTLGFALAHDPLSLRARGEETRSTLAMDLASLATTARAVDERFPGATSVMVSTLAWNDAGADAADELAIALSTGAQYLRSLLDEKLSVDQAARQIAVQIAVGRDTFQELCKVRALRVCWQKLMTGAGVKEPTRLLVHAVCAWRTMTARDPWVNMLRVTTQVFAGILGGADLVTPRAFDEALGTPSALAQRVARNTGLVLREESFLGKVADPAGGSYYMDTVTDALAREAWKRFQALEKDGGIVRALEKGDLARKLDAAWKVQLDRLAKRRTAILGVSEFANLDETLPVEAKAPDADAPPSGALPVHRDSETFEALRLRAEAGGMKPEARLVTLGPLAETRPRVGFALGFFAAGGIRATETSEVVKTKVACICGTDERYATEAIDRVRALKAAGCERVLVAGRPGALEPALREAGVDGFVFVGCDTVAVLTDLLQGLS